MRAYPQPGIFSMGARTHYYLELALRPGADVTGVLEAIAGEQGSRSTTGGCNVVVAFAALRQLFGADSLAAIAGEAYAELRGLVSRALQSGVVLDS